MTDIQDSLSKLINNNRLISELEVPLKDKKLNLGFKLRPSHAYMGVHARTHTQSTRVKYKHVDVHMCECGQPCATVHMGGEMSSFGVGALVAPCLRWDLLLWHISSICSWPAILGVLLQLPPISS